MSPPAIFTDYWASLPNVVELWISNVSLPCSREGQFTPKYHIWSRPTSQEDGWLNEHIFISRSMHDEYLCVAAFKPWAWSQCIGYSDWFHPSPWAWTWQRLKCWLIWSPSLQIVSYCQILSKLEHHKFIHQWERKLLVEIELSLLPLIKHCLDAQWNICRIKVRKVSL